jgi:hypothetical protein
MTLPGRFPPLRRSLAVISLLLLAACEPGAPPPSAPMQQLQPLLERLDRLIATLDARASAPTQQTVPPLTATADAPRTAAPEPTAEQGRIAQLEREVARLTAALGARPIPYSSVPAPMKSAAAVAPLIAAVEDETGGRENARRALFLRSEDEVLQQLGIPDEVIAATDDRTVWCYRDGERELNVQFLRGRAVNLF